MPEILPPCSIDAMCGTGIGRWGGPLPGDPSGGGVVSAAPVLGGIRVSWTWPNLNGHAVGHTRVYRNAANDFSTAAQIAVASGNYHVDLIDADDPGTAGGYYYWILIVSVNGTEIGPFGPAYAVPASTAGQMIEYLTGQIDRGVLAGALKSELDQLSIINANLANEIFARENGAISFAQALDDVSNGIAEALTFIETIQNSQVTDNTAIAEQITLLAATVGNQIAAITESMVVIADNAAETAAITSALYTIKLTVNGLIGGFGLYNEGTSVQAGFDVDEFWIGRTNADKRKPFIISGGVVYLDSAAIENATITAAKIGNAQIYAGHIVDGNITTAKIGTAQVDTLRVAGGAVTTTNFATGAALELPSGAVLPYVDMIGLVVDMGPSPNGAGVILQAHVEIHPPYSLTVGLQIWRIDTVGGVLVGTLLIDRRLSGISGYVGDCTLFAWDPAPHAGGDNYYLFRAYNPTTGPGSNVSSCLLVPTLLGWGGKR